MQYCPPLAHIDEELLLKQYNAFIDKEVRRFCVVTGINTAVHMEDMKSEASIAFLLCCRSIPIDSMELSLIEYKRCINKMRSAMRVSYWKIMNMGGYNNEPIDKKRSFTFTDLCAIYSDGTEEADIDTALCLGVEDDHSGASVMDFMSKLSVLDRTIIRLRMEKETYDEIAEAVNMKRQNLMKHFDIMRKQLTPMIKKLGFAQ